VQKKVKFIEDENYFEERHNNIESQFSVEDIQFLIDNLPDGYKMIFNLYAIEGFKHHEIATMLNINEGTSKSQLSHARKMLQEQITKSKNYHNGTE
jgi:RNA polymerase sigma-70 factor (ECF subfamily)